MCRFAPQSGTTPKATTPYTGDSEVWKTEICNGLDPTMVARTLTERGMFQRVGDGFQPVRKIDGANKRVYVVTAKIFDGGGDER